MNGGLIAVGTYVLGHKHRFERLLKQGDELLDTLAEYLPGRTLRVTAVMEAVKGDIVEVQYGPEERSAQKFKAIYSGWYPEALGVLRRVLPDRVAEFSQLSEGAVYEFLNVQLVNLWPEAPDPEFAVYERHGSRTHYLLAPVTERVTKQIEILRVAQAMSSR